MPKQYRTFEVYLVHVERDRCDGCEECLRFCPGDVFDVFNVAYAARPQNCLGCRTCEAVCKSKAVIVTEI
ncbi:MAG: 4Fe-4S dicluster domain-containing protein [Thermodesulfobacteriota bacterium]